MPYVVGVDIGGTFTDTVVMDDLGAIASYKSPTTPESLLDGLLGGNIVGHQTDEDRMNFLGCIESMLDADVDRQQGLVR